MDLGHHFWDLGYHLGSRDFEDIQTRWIVLVFFLALVQLKGAGCGTNNSA